MPESADQGYRRYVYEARAIIRPDKKQARVVDDKVFG
jgi:hypothetical protein